ncbi:MAG: phosphodiesterase [Gammaproteobacteria bacterium]|nr:phosphodiesterase [Gammaproteobacteria bacterium]
MMKDTGILLLAMALFATPVAHGDVISLPATADNNDKTFALSLPYRGMTMEAVTAQYGSALKENAPVGEPPIIRWDYEKFSVYFESKYVIHSVIKK